MKKTKYNSNIPSKILVDYFSNLINRIFKLLPMYEEKVETLDSCISYILTELNAGDKLILEDVGFLELIMNLESLNFLMEDYPVFKSQIFKSINICKKIISNLESQGDE